MAADPETRAFRPEVFELLEKTIATEGFESETAIDIGESQFLRSLKTYLEKIPHHGLDTLKLAVGINSATNLYYYVLNVTSVYEARRVQRRIVPYRGWQIPLLRRDESSTNAWEFSLPVPSTFDPFPEPEPPKIISDSQTLLQCGECEAKGKLPCPTQCDGGRVVCDCCYGKKRVPCSICSGTGKQRKSRIVRKTRKCSSCTANTIFNVVAILDDNPYTRARRCSGCRGTGVEHYSEVEHRAVNCATCKTTGAVSCQRCKNTGVLRCTACSGRGQVRCATCEGMTEVVSYLELRREFAPKTDTREIHSNDVDAAMLSAEVQNLAECDGELILDVWCEPLRSDNLPNIRKATSLGKRTSLSLESIVVETSQLEERNSLRCVSQRLQLSRRVISRVRYQVGRREYQAIFAPLVDSQGTRVLWPHISPAVETAKKSASRARTLAQSGEARDAAVEWRISREMGDADLFCKRAIERIASDISDDVQSMSTRVRLSSGRFLFVSTGGAIALLGFVALICSQLLLNSEHSFTGVAGVMGTIGMVSGLLLGSSGFVFFSR